MAGYGSGVPGQGKITAGPGHGQTDGPGQGVAVHMVETDTVGMLASALDSMTYDSDDQYADVLVWDEVDPRRPNTGSGQFLMWRPVRPVRNQNAQH